MNTDSLKRPLLSCGYRPDLIRYDFRYGANASVPLIGFAQIPLDSRSACVSVLTATTQTQLAVEACRPLGTPIVFVIDESTLQWWKQGATSAEWIENIESHQVANFFHTHQNEFSPKSVYRAKTRGRVQKEYQLSFVDLGLMPLIEAEIGEQLSHLIERNVSQLKKRLGWGEVTDEQGHWLLKSVFWLISGKILRDKQVPNFTDIDLTEVDDVFARVAKHYGSVPFNAGSLEKVTAIEETASIIDQFSSMALTTTESLGHVYENTLISKETRASLGTHSTPTYLVDYIVGHLASWIEEIPESERNVFEPACGHGAFLVAAMRLLTDLLPSDKAAPNRRGPYLRKRLHGMEKDPFAIELARLSLTLTDIPNPDGWDLCVQDMFIGDNLAEQTRGKTILLANPPYEKFRNDEKTAYANAGVKIGINNKAAEMLRRTLPELKPGSVFGVVVPQSILHGSLAADVRQYMIENFELREISLFPDKVFEFSDAESAVLIGRRLPARTSQDTKLKFRRIRERQMSKFRDNYDAPNSRTVEQSRFNSSNNWDMRVPDLENVWLALKENPTTNDFAQVMNGLIYKSKHLPLERSENMRLLFEEPHADE